MTFFKLFYLNKNWVKFLPLYNQSKVVCTLVYCSFSFLVGNVSSWLVIDFDNHVTHTKTNSFSNWSRCYLKIYHLHQLSKIRCNALTFRCNLMKTSSSLLLTYLGYDKWTVLIFSTWDLETPFLFIVFPNKLDSHYIGRHDC